MIIGEFTQRHGDILRPQELERHELSQAHEIGSALNPFVRGKTINGIAFAATGEVELALLSIGDTVVGVATGKNGLIAVDAGSSSSGEDNYVQIALKRNTRMPRLDVKLSSVVDLDIIYRPEGSETHIATPLIPEDYVDAEILSKFRPVLRVNTSFWKEYQLMISGGGDKHTAESVTIRTERELPVGIFALNPSNAVILQRNTDFLSDGVVDLRDARSMSARLQERPE